MSPELPILPRIRHRGALSHSHIAASNKQASRTECCLAISRFSGRSAVVAARRFARRIGYDGGMKADFGVATIVSID